MCGDLAMVRLLLDTSGEGVDQALRSCLHIDNAEILRLLVTRLRNPEEGRVLVKILLSEGTDVARM